MGRGVYSAGRSHGMARKPTAKKKLKRKSMVAATIPVALNVTEVVPARTAMHAHWPMAAKSMSLRRPMRSMSQIGMSEEKK
jgi:hypothetical protein